MEFYIFQNVVSANTVDFSWKNKQQKKTNEHLAKNKIIAEKRSRSDTFALEIFSGNCIHIPVQKVILPKHEWQKEDTKKTWDASQRPFTCACSVKRKPAGRCLIYCRTLTLFSKININRNFKLKIHDCDLSYSFVRIAPEKHEVGAKGKALLYY